MNETSGQNVSDLFDYSDPVGACLKTSLACSLRCLGKFVTIFEERVTRSGHWYWVPMMLAHRIDESGCGSWQTPNVIDETGRQYQYQSGDKSKKALCLPGQVKAWASPLSSDAKRPNLSTKSHGSGHSLPAQMEDWRFQPMPPYKETEGKTLQEIFPDSVGLAVQASHSTNGKPQDFATPSARGKNLILGKLNPDWVLQLQGFPDGWLNISDEEILNLMRPVGGKGTKSKSPAADDASN